MSKVVTTIWGRNFELSVIYQNYPGEEITGDQQLALSKVETADYMSAKYGVEDYIRKFFSDELGDDNLDNIFRFVIPTSVLLPRLPGKPVFAIMCNFKLDMEHGIALIFENGIFKTAGPKDLIL